MASNPTTDNEAWRITVIFTVVGAVVGAVGGGVGFGDGGVNVVAGLVGLVFGALVMGGLTLLTAVTVRQVPPWLGHLLAGAFLGWLSAGVIWEQRFDQKWQAQLTGLGIGAFLTLMLLLRARVEKSREDARRSSEGSPVTPGDGPVPPP